MTYPSVQQEVIALSQCRKELIREARAASISEEMGEFVEQSADSLFEAADVLDRRIFDLLDLLQPPTTEASSGRKTGGRP